MAASKITIIYQPLRKIGEKKNGLAHFNIVTPACNKMGVGCILKIITRSFTVNNCQMTLILEMYMPEDS